eukprot:RCo043294
MLEPEMPSAEEEERQKAELVRRWIDQQDLTQQLMGGQPCPELSAAAGPERGSSRVLSDAKTRWAGSTLPPSEDIPEGTLCRPSSSRCSKRLPTHTVATPAEQDFSARPEEQLLAGSARDRLHRARAASLSRPPSRQGGLVAKLKTTVIEAGGLAAADSAKQKMEGPGARPSSAVPSSSLLAGLGLYGTSSLMGATTVGTSRSRGTSHANRGVYGPGSMPGIPGFQLGS